VEGEKRGEDSVREGENVDVVTRERSQLSVARMKREREG